MIKLPLAFLLALVLPSHEQGPPESPCPDLFSYEKSPAENSDRWYGTITLKKQTQRWLFLNVIMDNKAQLFGTEAGSVSTLDNMDFRIDNDNMIRPGKIKFFVKHDLDMAPKLHIIRVDGIEICNSDNIPPVSVEPPPQTETIPIPGASKYEKCGTVKLNNPIPLVVGGVPTLEGQWPWQIALYRTEMVNHNFICGGTLVTDKHIITAAHCTTVRESEPVQAIDHTILSVYLGKHHLIFSVRGVQFRFVEKVTIHPNYNAKTIIYDISILQLQQAAEYTNWVQPACLWPESLTDLENVIGKGGSVVGWGSDGTGLLHLVEMPIVSELTCIRSNPEFYLKITTNTTYCAGFRDGRSACNGDSGGGMVFLMGSSWYLRGLVSVSPPRSPHEPVCDPTQYIVFTDVAKFLPWVRVNTL